MGKIITWHLFYVRRLVLFSLVHSSNSLSSVFRLDGGNAYVAMKFGIFRLHMEVFSLKKWSNMRFAWRPGFHLSNACLPISLSQKMKWNGWERFTWVVCSICYDLQQWCCFFFVPLYSGHLLIASRSRLTHFWEGIPYFVENDSLHFPVFLACLRNLLVVTIFHFCK